MLFDNSLHDIEAQYRKRLRKERNLSIVLNILAIAVGSGATVLFWLYTR